MAMCGPSRRSTQDLIGYVEALPCDHGLHWAATRSGLLHVHIHNLPLSQQFYLPRVAGSTIFKILVI
jgi:hypothetical protein